MMSTTTVTDDKDDSLIIVVNADGTITVDPETLQKLIVNSFTNPVSLVHVNNPESGSEPADSNDSSFNLTVESFVPPARPSDNSTLLQDLTDGDIGNETDPFSHLEPEHIARLENALKSDQAKEILGTKLDGGLSNMLNILDGKDAQGSSASAGRAEYPTGCGYPPPEVLIDHSYSVLAANAPHGHQQSVRQPVQSLQRPPPLKIFQGPRMRGTGARGLKTLGGIMRTSVSSQLQTPVVSSTVQAKEVTTHKYTMGPDGPVPVSTRKVTTPGGRITSAASSAGRTLIHSPGGLKNILSLSSMNKSQLVRVTGPTPESPVNKSGSPLAAKTGSMNILMRKGVAVRTIKANQKSPRGSLSVLDEPMDADVSTSTPESVEASSRESDDSEASGAEDSLIVDPSLDIQSSDGESEAEVQSPAQDQVEATVEPAKEASGAQVTAADKASDSPLAGENAELDIPAAEERAESSAETTVQKKPQVCPDAVPIPGLQPDPPKANVIARKPTTPKALSATKVASPSLVSRVGDGPKLKTAGGSPLVKQVKKLVKLGVKETAILKAKSAKLAKRIEGLKMTKPADHQKTTSPPKNKSPKIENSTASKTDADSTALAPKSTASSKPELPESDDKAKEKEKDKKKKDKAKSAVLSPLVLGPELFSTPDIIRRVSTDKTQTPDSGLLSPGKEPPPTPTTSANPTTVQPEEALKGEILSPIGEVARNVEVKAVEGYKTEVISNRNDEETDLENPSSPEAPVEEELSLQISNTSITAGPPEEEHLQSSAESEGRVDELHMRRAASPPPSENPMVLGKTPPRMPKVEVLPAHPDIPCPPMLADAESLLNSIHEKVAKADPSMLRDELLYDLTNDDYDVDFPGFAKIEEPSTGGNGIKNPLAVAGLAPSTDADLASFVNAPISNTTTDQFSTPSAPLTLSGQSSADSDPRVRKLPPIEVPKTRSATKKASIGPAQIRFLLLNLGRKKAASTDHYDSSSEDDPNKLWCICRKPHNNRFMICCDGCEDWFHGNCVGVTKALGQQMEAQGVEWSCPKCRAAKREKEKESQLAAKALKAMPANQRWKQLKEKVKTRVSKKGAKPATPTTTKPPAAMPIQSAEKKKDDPKSKKDRKVKSLAESIEEELFSLFKDTNMKYRTKFRSLVFNIKDSKNLTLYRKIVDRTISPEQFVRLTAEELASQELAQWREKEAKHQIEMIKKNELALIHQAKTVVLKSRKGEEILESKNHEANISELESALNRTAEDYEESTVKKENEINPPLIVSEKSVIKEEKVRDKEKRRDRKRSHRSRSKSRGRDRKRSRSRSKERSKRSRVNSKERDSKDKSKRGASDSKERHSKRTRSRSRDDERIHYVSLYSYLSTRNRMAVVASVSKTIKDFYVMPLSSHSPIPQVLLPLDGPGFDETRNHLLLAIIVRNRRNSRPTPTSRLSVKSAPDRSYTPPIPDGGSTTPPLPPMSSKSLPLPPVASMTDDPDDDDTPYDPGEGMADEEEADLNEPYTPTQSPPRPQNAAEPAAPHPDIAKNLEEVEKLIEEKKQKIEAYFTTNIPGLGDTPPEYPSEVHDRLLRLPF
ncbi:unnamed protein product [Nesidiocoris tenuis]|uniref:PHD-type domain-containing protein n=1 Tax=Nesidiocoris tenuis TaxID=355587 RepID=A0A6H5HQB6_9HEMI|nr:unnamed protein product [Nesidiocoris tenuis]